MLQSHDKRRPTSSLNFVRKVASTIFENAIDIDREMRGSIVCPVHKKCFEYIGIESSHILWLTLVISGQSHLAFPISPIRRATVQFKKSDFKKSGLR
mmetsp:Transcript_31772/g.74775  ORF Transcript_31772/g.74775 Transcript_31772/m.74775 type:complete len:97 (-) Transcript_31772:1112-1402(-)